MRPRCCVHNEGYEVIKGWVMHYEWQRREDQVG